MPTLRKPLLVLLLWGSAVGGSFAQLSANFTNQIACDRNVTFTNTSTGYTTVSWNFGDGNTSSSVSPTHQYAASGTFNVQLTVSNGGLSTNFSQSITLYDPPSQNITGSLSVCANAQETYSVSSLANNYVWSVTGGVIMSGQGTNSITVRWIQNGTVTLTERNASGCISNISASVVVHPLPITNINISTDQGTSINQRGGACLYSTEVYELTPPLNPGSTYLWEVTGGNIVGTASADSVVVNWTVEGAGSIEVTETTSFGCISSDLAVIQVLPIPHANFRTVDICLGNTANFTDLSTGDFNGWFWEFGDGATSSYQNPTHVYTAAGSYNVRLTIATNADSTFPAYITRCPDDTIITINVDQNPGPEISCPGTVCAGDVETYSTPAIAGATYTWAVTGGAITGGGGTSDNEVTITWGSGPVGTISLLVSGAGTYCNIPTVIEIPIIPAVTHIAGPTTVCRFTYTEYQAPLLPGSVYNWTVTGGNLTDGQGTSTITTYFGSIGTKTISVDVFHDLTECGGQDALTAQVFEKFYLSGSNSACTQTTQTYTLSGTPAPAGYTWNWTATGGTITAGQGTSSITVQWGNGPVGEIVVDAPAGIYCNAQERMAVTVKPLPPPAALNGAMNVCASSTNTYYVPAGLYTTWTLTGGTVTSGGTAGSNYATVAWGSGTTGQITVQQEDRSTWPYCATTTNFSVSISNNTPVTITGPTPVCQGYTATYTAGSNPAVPYLWEVSGGNIISGFGTNSITVQWGSGPWGNLQATELVCNNSDDMLVQITGANPAVIDTADLTCDGSSLTLLVPGNYVSYDWSTGGTTASISITSAGNYSVSLTDANGCTTEAAMTLGALPVLPVPSASITGAGPVYSPLVFLELTAHPASKSYQWSTGGTTQSIYVNTAGIYNVTVTNEYGCTAAATVTVIDESDGGLSGGGGVCFGGGPGSPCPGTTPDFTNSTCNPIQFTNTTSPAAFSYVWDFGDGAYAWTANASHSYTHTGNFTVDLWATDDGICWSRTQHTVTITSLLDANFSFAQACFGQPVQFTDLSTSALPITSWLWNFGDGNTSTAQDPSDVYATPGTYIVQLTIADGVCADVIQDTVIIRNLMADFTYQQACFGMPTLFTDNSTSALQIALWDWNFGDGGTSAQQHPSHNFTTVGNHSVTLTITDVAGCTASTTIVLDVTQFTAGNITYSGPTAFCQGEYLTLNAPAGAGYTYQWSTGETTASIDATEGGAYYAVVTNADGCKDTTAPVTVTVYPRPFAFITATGPLTFCEFSRFVQLIANPAGPGFTYQWMKNGVALATTQSTSVSNATHSGNYTVIVTDNHGCKDTSEVAVVTIFPNPPFPTITPSGPTTFCDGGNVVLTAPAGYQYEWSNGALTQSITVLNSGFQRVTITDANGCQNSNGQNVTVHAVPDMRLVAYGCYDVCISDSNVIYGPPGMSSYQWSTGETSASILIDAAGTYNLTATNNSGCTNSSSNLYISTTNFLGIDLGHDTSFCQGGVVMFDAGAGFTSYEWQDGSAAQTFTVNSTGIYSVDVTDTNGCKGGDTVAVNVFPNPVVSLQGDSVCDTLAITLDAGSGFATYLWNDNSTNQTLSVSSTGTYSVTVTDANTCSATDAAFIFYMGLPSGFSLGSDRNFCGSATVTFDAGAGYISYTWQDGSTNQTFTADTTGEYIVQVATADGCVARDTVVLNIFPNPTVSLIGDTTICDTLAVILDAGSGFAAYLWNDNSTNQTLAVSSSGTYSVTVTDVNTCTATDAVDITYGGASSSLINASPPDTVICQGVTVQLSVSGGISYVWTADPTLSSTTNSNPTATPTSSTTYYVSAIDSSGCAQSDSVHINILPLLTAQGSADTILCSGNSVQLTASGGTQFSWSPANGLSCTDCSNPVANPQHSTTYTVEVSQPGYCNTDVVSISVNVLPLPEAGLDSVITIKVGDQATFTPNGGMADYDWWAEGWRCDGCPAPTVSPAVTTLYTLQVTDSLGCTATQQVLLRVREDCDGNFFIPTAFSPNGDGHNDEFRILHPGGEMRLIDFKVFNRWGEIVFETEDPDEGWDGKYKGVTQDLVVFAYYAQMSCGQEVKTIIGNVTLVH